MADYLQLKMLKKGREAWHQWRREHPEATVDLREVDFQQIDLRHAKLWKADLRQADLRQLDLRQANLWGANLWGADMSAAYLPGAYLSEANLSEVRLTKAILSKANLSKANLFASDLCRANLLEANLSNANLLEAELHGANFWGADLSGANLKAVDLSEANLTEANLQCADLSGAYLSGAQLSRANLTGANLSGANFQGVNFSNANLSNTDLSEASLEEAIFVRTKIDGAKLSYCRIYGLSVWDVKGVPETQTNLVITPINQTAITVDSLEVAQFIYLLLENEKLKKVIDTVTSKAVLILGRFTEERKAVLDAIKAELVKQNFTPILVDFTKPDNKDVLGTVETLARMCRFIIADLTDPSSVPLELATIIPFLCNTPVLPIKLKGSEERFTMFEDLRRRYRDWVLDTFEYQDGLSLIAALPQVIAPANERVEILRKR